MTVPPESPFTPPLPVSSSTETIGRITRPRRIPPLQLKLDRAQIPAAALGVALVSPAIVVATVQARVHHHLDWSNYTMGLLATAGLLAVASAALIPDAEKRASLVSWPGTAGILGTGLMVGVGIHTHPETIYTTSSVVLVLSAGAYLVTKAPAFTLGAIAGAALLYGQAFRDVIDIGGGFSFGFMDDTSKDTNTFMIVGAGIVVFVVVATALCWVLLPATRVMNGIVIGAGSIAGLYELFTFLSLNRDLTSGSYGEVPSTALVNDLWAVLGYSVGLAAFWLLCSLVSGHVGFRILAVVVTVLAVPSSAYALAVSHPTWWEVVACGAGGLVLAATGVAAWTLKPVAAEPEVSEPR